MMTFLEYLEEARLKKQEEQDVFKYKVLAKQIQSMHEKIYSALKLTADEIIMKFCKLCKIDYEKFISENKNATEKIVDLILPNQNSNFVPIAVLYYSSTDTYMLALAATSGSIFKTLIGMSTGLIGFIYNKIAGNNLQLLLVPVKFNARDNYKMDVDMTAAGIGQLAMTLLLSDVDCEVTWPVKFGDKIFSKCVMQTIDFICPSLVDLLSLCTVGGASVAARAAKLMKYSTNVGTKAVKIASKAGSKRATKALIKKAPKGLKASAKSKKVLAKVPNQLRMMLRNNKNTLKAMSKTSRSLKKDIRALVSTKQTLADVKDEILSMSTDDMFAFSQTVLKILIAKYLPEQHKEKINRIMDKIPDDVIDKVTEYAKNKVKSMRNEDAASQVTICDLVTAAIPTELKDKFKKAAKLIR